MLIVGMESSEGTPYGAPGAQLTIGAVSTAAGHTSDEGWSSQPIEFNITF